MATPAPSTTEPVAADTLREVYVPLHPLAYTGAVPKPHEACTDPTPDQQIKAALKEKEELLKQREAEQAARATTTTTAEAKAPADPEGTASSATAGFDMQQIKDSAAGALDGLRSLVSQLSLSVEKATADATARAHTQARALDQQQGYDRFSYYFGEDLVKGQGEVLLADYACTAMHNGAKVNGHLFITRNYLCFAAEFNSALVNAAEAIKSTIQKDLNASHGPAAVRTVGVKQAIPLKNIASVVRSVVLPTVDNGAPYFLPLPADYVVATALQVYEKEEKKLYQFLQFDSLTAKAGSVLSSVVKGTPLDRAYNYLDHAWREAVKVPVDGVEYA